MKRYNYTITELLTVIAIIAILAGIAIPAVGYARRRARTSACISNQGQTMKTLINAMTDTNNRLYSGTDFSSLPTNGTVSNDAGWTVFLAAKGYIKSMEALRCPDIRSYNTSEKEMTAASAAEAYGLVFTTNNNGKFDFRGTRLFMHGNNQVAPSVLTIGGCATGDGSVVNPKLNLASASVANTGRATKVHHNNMTNLFFFDGHAETLDAASYHLNKYYPNQTGNTTGEALEVNSASLIDALN